MVARLGYWRRLACKTICFGCFGLGAFALGVIVYPAMLLFFRDRGRLKKATRRLVSCSFSSFLRFMEFFGLIKIDYMNPDALSDPYVSGRIVAANHPSLIDVIILGSRLHNADCIVKRALWNMPFVHWIVRRSYIPNSLCFDETVDLCGASLTEGGALIIFPEGTRTKEGKAPKFLRGAARIAISTGVDILPIRIVTEDVRGLRKGDPFFSLPLKGPVKFRIEALAPIPVGEYSKMEPSVGARALTKRLSEVICNFSSSTESAHG